MCGSAVVQEQEAGFCQVGQDVASTEALRFEKECVARGGPHSLLLP